MKLWLKIAIPIVTLGIVACVALACWQLQVLKTAHSTFDNYYAFRGCTKLLERTSTYGICATSSGATIKIVLYQGRWFLDGDLPCASGICW